MDKNLLESAFLKVLRKYASDDGSRFIMRNAVRAIIWDKSDGHCWYCGKLMNPFSEFSVDHVIPVSSGGTETYNNLVPCCRNCNRSKNDAALESWRQFKTSQNGNFFSDAQIDYLDSIGVTLPSDAQKPHHSYLIMSNTCTVSHDCPSP